MIEETIQKEADKPPYFMLSRNAYGRAWLHYEPRNEDGKLVYACWMPIDEKFYSEIESLLAGASRNKVIEECIEAIEEDTQTNAYQDQEIRRTLESLKSATPKPEISNRNKVIEECYEKIKSAIPHFAKTVHIDLVKSELESLKSKQ